ncbi:cathelicidin-2-like [Monodelphis domestica]|uniref:Cathelicidin-2-like n=1 Tax=Monodelphis domestica TaxID=13616 RepID=K7E235_MONDO|nr:cathelicidin-2-like [Monodelphis domestica]
MRMEKGWTMQVPLLVLGLLSLLTPLASAQDLNYQNAVTEFIREYNSNIRSGNLFRLSVLTLPPGEGNNPTLSPVSFTITETVCQKEDGRDPEECDFKDNGMVKECFGVIRLEFTKPIVDVSCDGASKTKRRSLLKRLGDGIRGFWNGFRGRK